MASKQEALDALKIRLTGQAKLYGNDRNLVFGMGNPDAKLMNVGEAPGDKENEKGEPFVGPSGVLLNAILTRLLLPRAECYTTNIVKYQPPGNRIPTDEEMAKHAPYLMAEIAIIRPRVILALGRTSVSFLTGVEGRLSDIRRTPRLRYFDPKRELTIPIVATWHPSYVLRQADEGDRVPLQELIEDMRRAVALSKEETHG